MPIIRQIFHPLAIDAAHLEIARQSIREALAVLRQPQADTFLGRETYKPFPKQNTENNISDGNRAAPVQRIAAVLVTIACLFAPALARAEPVRIVALGDSLTAGFGLPVAEAFPTRLQAALKAKGIKGADHVL